MKFLTDLLPVILFFIAYKLFDIYLATGVAIAAAAAQVAWNHFRHRRVENIQWITLGLLLVFGGLTIALRDPTFIKWKPTVVNWLFAAAFLLSGLFMERNLLRRMMDHAIDLPEVIWSRLNTAWIAFFVVSGISNLYVAYSYSEEVWVNFKLFGLMGLTLVFIVAQGFYLARHLPQTENATEE